MSPTTNAKFRVAICGGGLAGLTAAIALGKNKDMHINIYESAHRFNEIGTGVGMYPRPWRVMQTLGLENEIKKLTKVPEAGTNQLIFSIRKSDQAEGIPFYDVVIPEGTLLVRRSEFQNILVSQLDPEVTTTHFAKRLVSYSQLNPSVIQQSPEPITLHFSDGTTATCDVLIGADGIHSATRRQMLREYAEESKDTAKEFLDNIDPVWTGTYAYRAIIPIENLAAINPNHKLLTTPMIYVGKSKHIVAFPMSGLGNTVVNVVAFVSNPEKEWTPLEGKIVEEKSHDEILEMYAGWEPEVIQLMQCVDKPLKWAICELKGLPTSVRGAIALVGDAAHAMTPHEGSGAGQAIEDAYILAEILSHPLTTKQNVHEAIRIYEQIRLPFANGVQSKSRTNGKLMEMNDDRFRDVAMNNPDESRLRALKDAMSDIWNWAWNTTPEVDRKSAITLLEAKFNQQALAF